MALGIILAIAAIAAGAACIYYGVGAIVAGLALIAGIVGLKAKKG